LFDNIDIERVKRPVFEVGHTACAATSGWLSSVRRRLGDESRDPAWRHATPDRSRSQLWWTVADESLRPARHCPVCYAVRSI